MPAVPGTWRKVLKEFLEDTVERGKNVAEVTRPARQVASGSFRLAKHFEYVEIISRKSMSKDTVHFTEAEKDHLRNGGVIVVVHACGTETHVSSPW